MSYSYPTDTDRLQALFGNLTLQLQGCHESPPSGSTAESSVPINSLPAASQNDHPMYNNATQLNERRTMMMMIEVPHIIQSLRFALRSSNSHHYLGCVLEELITGNRGIFFTAVVFDQQGSVCIVEFIKRLKRTQYIDSLTQALAPSFYKIMIHPVAKKVVLNCLKYLGARSNMVFYKQAIFYCVELATNKVGCLSLNECIDTMDWNTRKLLLHEIAENSRRLSHDQYGNYVVQNVLAMRDPEVNNKILRNLTDQFMSLSKNKEGSHLAEKCLECCPLGVIQIVGEMLKNPDEALVLAGHECGNYVVQKALAKARKGWHMNLYWKLVKILKDGREDLNKSEAGRHVLYCIRNELHRESRSRSIYVRKQG